MKRFIYTVLAKVITITQLHDAISPPDGATFKTNSRLKILLSTRSNYFNKRFSTCNIIMMSYNAAVYITSETQLTLLAS